ncbi:hypothetical protein Pan241w_29240 [Gimesia alba]|uniref:Uncharacterized protein n=1 Tax=Gimesia alba TaxID=2527973 RepID=A0A517RG65_9PLAN|nr:SIR2 family protein [Gimesia alba]QDT42835.1 hypothetical protein Pan241w_29240 [Gimesia alba]
MFIEEILDGIEHESINRNIAFETFMLNLLEHHLERQNKPFLRGSYVHDGYDALAPDGFDKLRETTYIEFKYDLKNIPSSYWKRYFSRLCYSLSPSDKERSNLLIISAKQATPRIKDRICAAYESFEGRLNLFLWGPTQIEKIAKKYKTKINEIADNLFSLRLASAVSETKDDWKSDREVLIEDLRNCYLKGQFSLFLGAGVSSSAGMPDWNTLLNSLFVTYLTQEFRSDIKISVDDIKQLVLRLKEVDEPSTLMAARYLRRGLSQKKEGAKEFVSEITRNLYELRDESYDIDSRLLMSLASMCIPRRTGAKVSCVVTYNFDDLFEKQLDSKSINYRCIYTDSESDNPDELPVYHVHGFLPEYNGAYDDLEKSTLVFAEEGYHQIYTDSYHWSNLVQLNRLRENTCLMVGLSMTDPNLRRLLDIAAKNNDRTKHFVFLKRLKKETFCFENKDGKKHELIKNQEGAEKFLKGHHVLNEELMKELGVAVIWYEEYDDIPEILERIIKI